MSIAIGVTIALILLTLAGVVWAIVTRRGTLRIVLPILGVLFTGFLSLVLLVMLIINSIPVPTQFNPASYKGPMGKVKVPLTGKATLVCNQRSISNLDDLLEFSVVNGEVMAPEGSFTLASYSNTLSDSSGRTFRTEAKFPNPIDCKVVKTSPCNLKLGPPYLASVELRHSLPGKLDISLSIVGTAGEQCTISDTSGKAKPAQFQILSKSGKLLMTDKFEAG